MIVREIYPEFEKSDLLKKMLDFFFDVKGNSEIMEVQDGSLI